MPTAPDRTESELIDGCRRGHAPSQEALYRRFWSFAMSVALRYTPSRDDALELAHDAFLRAFRQLDRFDADRSFKPWFRTILVRLAVDRHRSTRRYHATIEPEAEPPESTAEGTPMDALEAADILRLLRVLPDDHRAVFNLYEIEGYSHDEIAAMLGIAAGTSRSHLTRAKSRLRDLYHEHNPVSS
ncbi:MAG: sigma-70 family RNA polymerase sigma factor [Bacteroidota bacterium]